MTEMQEKYHDLWGRYKQTRARYNVKLYERAKCKCQDLLQGTGSRHQLRTSADFQLLLDANQRV